MEPQASHMVMSEQRNDVDETLSCIIIHAQKVADVFVLAACKWSTMLVQCETSSPSSETKPNLTPFVSSSPPPVRSPVSSHIGTRLTCRNHVPHPYPPSAQRCHHRARQKPHQFAHIPSRDRVCSCISLNRSIQALNAVSTQ